MARRHQRRPFKMAFYRATGRLIRLYNLQYFDGKPCIRVYKHYVVDNIYYRNSSVFSISQMKDHSALLIVDVISDFEFVDGDALFKNARKAIKNIKRLKKNFLADGMPVLYVNDS